MIIVPAIVLPLNLPFSVRSFPCMFLLTLTLFFYPDIYIPHYHAQKSYTSVMWAHYRVDDGSYPCCIEAGIHDRWKYLRQPRRAETTSYYIVLFPSMSLTHSMGTNSVGTGPLRKFSLWWSLWHRLFHFFREKPAATPPTLTTSCSTALLASPKRHLLERSAFVLPPARPSVSKIKHSTVQMIAEPQFTEGNNRST